MELFRFFQELIVRHHPVLDEQAKAFPFLLELLSFFVEDLFQFVGYFLCDVVVDLLYVRVALQITSAYIERDIRAIDDAVQQHQKFRNDVFYLVGNKNLVAVQLDLVLLNLVALFDLREIKDAREVEGIVHIQMDPE